MNHFEILGVPLDATQEQIVAAYRVRARQLHPDTKPDATPAERARLTEAMAQLNEAWTVLRDPGSRAGYLQRLERGAPNEEIVVRMPADDECVMCGSHPAAMLKFQHQRAWVLAASLWWTEARLCRDCGRALGRSSQNRTLWTGWWGLVAFFRNVGVIVTNGIALARASRLGAPRQRRGEVFVPFVGPLPPGRPVWQRSGAAFVIVAVLALAAAGAFSDGTARSGQTPTTLRASWRVGACVSPGTFVRPVDCSQANGGKVIARAATQYGCPVSTRSYVSDSTGVWCIDR